MLNSKVKQTIDSKKLMKLKDKFLYEPMMHMPKKAYRKTFPIHTQKEKR